MTTDRQILIAVRLQELGVSQAGVIELLSQYPLDLVEQQLAWLPLRKAKRPEAFIIEAVRNNYSPPKEAFHAQTEKPAPQPEALMDEAAELPAGQAPAEPQRYGAPGALGVTEADIRLEQAGSSYDLALPPAQTEDGPRE